MKRLLLVLLLIAVPAFSEVKDSAAAGFTVGTTLQVKGTPDEAFRKITDIAHWWSSKHTYSGDARNLAIEARPGGCWCEKLPNGGVMHMQVLTIMPGQLLVLTGGLGPLQQMGATGAMTFKLAKSESGTTIEFLYVVSGYAPNGMKALAPVVDSVLMDAMSRLARYIDTGDPAAPTNAK